MSEITKAIAARQTQIARLKSEIETLQRAASIVGPPAQATAKRKAKAAKPKAKPQPKQARPKAKPQPKAKAKKRHQWTAAEKAAIGKRMKAYWAKRRKAGVSVAPKKRASKKAVKQATKGKRKPMTAAQKKLVSAMMKAYWAARRKAKT